MERFPWLLLFDKKEFFIIALASFLAVLVSMSLLFWPSSGTRDFASQAQEKRWPLRQDIDEIARMQLFGIKQQQVEKVASDNRLGACKPTESDDFYLTVPKADTAASVRALVLSTQSSLSVAVIDIAGQQQLFSQGDTLTNGGGEIVRILTDRVILRDDGHCSALMFVE